MGKQTGMSKSYIRCWEYGFLSQLIINWKHRNYVKYAHTYMIKIKLGTEIKVLVF